MKVLIIPQFSMRSYKDSKYSLLADGNLNIVLHQIYRSNESATYDITIPINHREEEFNTLVDLVAKFNCNIAFKPIEYGINADDNRLVVPKTLSDFDYAPYSFCISYFEYLRPTIPWILKMHMSQIKELARPYADKHFPAFVNALSSPNLIVADVLNYAQKAFVPSKLQYKVSVNELCLNTDFYSLIVDTFKDQNLIKILDDMIPLDSCFFPFRVSDKAYCYEHIKKTDYMVVTDPNESSKDADLNLSTELKDYDIKTILINTLLLIQDRPDIMVPIHENCELAVHQLIIELCYMIPNNVIGMDTGEIIERYTFR